MLNQTSCYTSLHMLIALPLSFEGESVMSIKSVLPKYYLLYCVEDGFGF